MKKLRMNVEDLSVESFSIRSGDGASAAGTVKAYAGDSTQCFSAFGCGSTGLGCGDTGAGCGDWSIQCSGTCDFTANSDCQDTLNCSL